MSLSRRRVGVVSVIACRRCRRVVVVSVVVGRRCRVAVVSIVVVVVASVGVVVASGHCRSSKAPQARDGI